MGGRRFIASVLTCALLVGLGVSAQVMAAPAAQAAALAPCNGQAINDQNGIRVQASHGSVLYIDTSQSQNIDAAYLAYRVSNVSGAAVGDLWASVDGFTGGVVRLANARDSVQPVGDLAANTTGTAFFLVTAPQATTAAQSHVLTVHEGRPGLSGSTALYQCQFTFAKVSETIKAAANKVTSVTSTSVATLGGTMTITVQGNTGTVGSGPAIDGSMMWLSPAARSNWPTSSLRLESTSVRLFTNPSKNSGEIVGSPFTNQLRIPLASTTKYYYTAVYTFRIIGPAPSAATAVVPIAQISSGTQVKHTDLANIPTSTINATAPSTALTVRKNVSSSIQQSASGPVLTYSVTLTNTGPAVTVDAILDEASGGFAPVRGTSTYNGVTTGDPVSQQVGPVVRSIFTGPFSVPAGSAGTPTVRTLTYQMSATECSSSFQVSNTAVATLGETRIGSGPTTVSRVIAGAQCGAAALETLTLSDDPIDIEVTTFPATSVTTTGATLNGLVDPNGNSGEAIRFDWGTSPSLAVATVVLAGTTTAGALPYGVSTTLSSLEPGTTYYFRVRAGSVQGDILSFRTPEPVGLPESVTTTPTGITNAGAATFTGLVDPNQVNWGAKVRFQYALDASTGACTSLGSITTTGFVQSETDNGSEDAILYGSSPTEVTHPMTGLASGAWYCVRVVAYHDATASQNPTWSTAIPAPNWVAFRVLTKLSQTITFPALADLQVGGTGQAMAMTSAPGLAVTYSSNTPATCSVTSSGAITAHTTGTCSITASQPGNVEYEEALSVTRSLTVTLRSQVISAETPEPLRIDDAVALTASTSAGDLPLSFESLTPETCSVDAAGVVTALTGGACEVRITQAGSNEYAAATPVVVSLIVLAPQALILEAPGSLPTGQAATPTATTTADGLAVTIVSLTPDTCVMYEGELLALDEGECVLEARQPGSNVYAPAEPVQAVVTITLGSPVVATVTLDLARLDSPYGFELDPAGGSGTYINWMLEGALPDGITFDAETGTLSGTPTQVGEFEITVTVTDDLGETSRVRTLVLVVARAPHTIDATSVTLTYGETREGPFGASSVGAALGYEVADTTVATVAENGTIEALRVGETSVTLTAAGSERVDTAAPVVVTITVVAAVVTVTAPSATVVYGAATPPLTPQLAGFVATDTAAALTAAPTCSTDYNATTPAGSSIAVTCDGASAANYTFAYVDGAIDVKKAPQEIGMLDTAPESLIAGNTAPLRFTASSGAMPSVQTSGPCSWADGVLSVTSAGECVVTVTAIETDNHLAASPVVVTVSVTAVPRELRTPRIRLEIGGSPSEEAPPQRLGTLPLVGTELLDGDGPVTLRSLTPDVCTVDDDHQVHLHAAGDCVLQAHAAATDEQEEATAVLQFAVLAAERTLALVLSHTTLPVGGTATLTAVPSAGAGDVTYRLVSGSGCTLSGSTLFADSAGACVVDATISSDGVYGAVDSQRRSVVVEATSGRGGDGSGESGGSDGGERPGGPTTPTVPTAPTSPSTTPTNSAPTSPTVVPALGPAAPVAAAVPGSSPVEKPAAMPISPSAAGTTATATGARTIAQLLVVGGLFADGAVNWSLDESVSRLGGDRAAITARDWAASPSRLQVGTPAAADDLRQIGLGDARSVGDVVPATATQWLFVQAEGVGYRPGSTVTLVVTSSPIVLAETIADARGRVVLSASIPMGALEPGIHRLRLVGPTVLTDLSVAESGELVWGEQAAAELAAMDAGTTVIVDVDGRGMRIELLPQAAKTPWWLLVLATGLIGIALAGRMLAGRTDDGSRRVTTRRRVVGVGVAVLAVLASGVAAAVGWLTVAPVLAVIVGVASVAALTIASWPAAPQRQEQFATAN